MKNKTKLRIFDTLAYGIIIFLGLFFLFLILGQTIQNEFLIKIGGIFIGFLFLFFILFWISMVLVCINNMRWGYLFVLIILAGAVVAHLFYFKVYRKTLI